MMFSFSLKSFEATAVRARRLFVICAGIAALFFALYLAPAWLETRTAATVLAAVVAAAMALGLAVAIAIRGSAAAVKRAALELAAFGCALAGVEVVLLLQSPTGLSLDPDVQRVVVRNRAATTQGIDVDSRLRTEVANDLRSRGVDAVPGFVQSVGLDPMVAAAIRDRNLLPLSNVSNVQVVECNEGVGYFQFRSDEFGFNNPPGLASGPVDVAVIGESLALGHCVQPDKSVVARVRSRFARTADFGVAGSRVLSQLGVFREYVAPLKPAVVVWFVNTGYAEPRAEGNQPILTRYLDDPSFVQGLRHRQHEVDAFVRELLVPLNERRDAAIRRQLDEPPSLSIRRVLGLSEVRSLIDVGRAGVAIPAPNLAPFSRAIDAAASAASEWGGRLIVMILPSNEVALDRPDNAMRYKAISAALASCEVEVVDGVSLFARERDVPGLYTLRIDNHPSERGHALLAEALINKIERVGNL